MGLVEADLERTDWDDGFREPSEWYTDDYVQEVTLPGPVTLRQLFLAVLRVKSGRNDWWYELLGGVEVEAAEDRSLTITLSFDHGS